MGDQHVCILRNQLPLGPYLGSSFQVESPIVEPGLPGAAVEFDTVIGHFQVLEIDAVGQDLFTCFPVLLEAEIMVAGNDNLVEVGQGAQEIVEFSEIAQGPMAGQVASVD